MNTLVDGMHKKLHFIIWLQSLDSIVLVQTHP